VLPARIPKTPALLQIQLMPYLLRRQLIGKILSNFLKNSRFTTHARNIIILLLRFLTGAERVFLFLVVVTQISGVTPIIAQILLFVYTHKEILTNAPHCDKIGACK
jgi:hypothetical protein